MLIFPSALISSSVLYTLFASVAAPSAAGAAGAVPAHPVSADATVPMVMTAVNNFVTSDFFITLSSLFY